MQQPKSKDIVEAQEITYQTAESKFGAAAVAVIDKISKCYSKAARKMDPKDYKWSLGYIRSEDPPAITDHILFAQILCTNSKSYLVAKTGNPAKVSRFEELMVTPDIIRAKFEQRARMVCSERSKEKMMVSRPQSTPDEGPLESLENWARANPNHNASLAAVAKIVLEQLLSEGPAK